MSLARPEALLLLLLLLPLGWISIRARPRAPGWPFAFALRGLFVALLALALARPVVTGDWPPRRQVVVADVSESAGPIEAVQAAVDRVLRGLPESDDVRMVVAGRAARELPSLPNRPRAFPPLASVAFDRTGSDLAAAADLAAALVPLGIRGRMVLVTDGRETAGHLAAAAARSHVDVEVEPIGARAPRPVLLPLHVPGAARVGASIPLDLAVEAPSDAPLTAVLRGIRPETAPQTAPLEVRGGKASARLDHEVRATGLNELELVLHDAGGRPIEGTRVPLAFEGLSPVAVRLVEDRDAPSAREPVAALLGPGFDVAAVAAQDLPAGEAAPSPLTIVADVPAAAFAPGALEGLRAAVEDGMGLVAAGGRRSFGPGGWAHTPLEEILPVRFVQKEERRDPSATLAIIIDTSGSMSGNRIELAKEVARLALRRLKPHDKAGIVEFHGAKRWAAPIQPASNAVDLQRALNRLVAGGGTVIFPAIEEAYYALLNVRTRTRHALVITDGGVEQGAFEQLARRMADHGMTVSTVLVGASAGHSDFLVSLAQWGRGRYYHAPDRFTLPEVLVKQPESSLMSPWNEGPARVRAEGDAVVAAESGLDDAEVQGVVQTEAREGAEVLLRAGGGEPLLSRWRHGLGVVASWTSELAGPWTGSLAADPDYGRLLAGVAREAARAAAPGEVRLVTVLRGDALTVFASRPEGTPEPGRIRVEIEGPSGWRAARSLPFGPAGSDPMPVGLVFERIPAGLHRITARDDRSGAVLARGAVARPEPTEWTRLDPDREGLEALVRAEDPVFLEVARKAGSFPAPGREIWRECLAAALAAFLLMVLARRLPWRRAGGAAAALLLFLAVVPAAGAQTPVTATATATVTDAPAPASGTAPPARALDQEADEPLPAEVLDLLKKAAAPDGAGALTEAIRLVRARDGHLEALIRHLQAAAKAASDAVPAIHLAQVAAAAGKPAIGVEALVARTDLPSPGFAALARLQEFQGRDDDALAALDRALARGPDPASEFMLRIRRAGLLFGGPGRSAEAVAELRTLLATRPGDADVAWYLATLAALHGAPDLLLGLEARPDGHAYPDRLLLGTFALRTGKHADAQRHFAAALDAAPLQRDRRFAQERLIAAHRAGGTLPGLADAWLAAADRPPERTEALVAILRELRRPEAALDLLLAGRTGGGESAADADLQREIIGLAMECGRDAEVQSVYRTLIEREPRKVPWRTGLALLHLLRGEREAAARVFTEAADAAGGDGKQCLRIAQGARDLALEAVAVAAAEKAAAADEASRVRAELFLAEMEFRKGLSEDAAARLKRVEEANASNDEALLQVADAHDRFQREDEAVRVLKTVADRSGGEDVVMRLAWLLEKRKQTKDALELWRKLWAGTKIAARARQAEDRILDLAAKEAQLADIAIELEEALDRGEGAAREMSLLVKIYARANDPVAAVEILRAHGGKLGRGEVETLQDMARVFQHCDDYRRYEETLRRLQELEPASVLDYQQQLALGALERGRGRQVKKALAKLAEMAGDDLEALEFSAGALALVQLQDEAAVAYAKVIARHPDRIESWLLWGGVLRDAQRAGEAQAVTLDLAEHADKDDLFTIAVDGLLNLNSPPPVLKAALRRVKERTAAKPEKAFLYQLAADLEEELGRPEGQEAMTALMALAGGERRGAILRELMDMARERNRPADVIDYGRSLLALGDELPPNVFLDLGQAMVRTNDLAGAEQVFGRTREEGDFVAVQQKVAGYYEAAGHLGDAERILRQALLARPDDVELLLQVGALAETAGRSDQAVRDFESAVDLLVRRTPTRVADPAEGGQERRTSVIRLAGGVTITHVFGGGAWDPNADPWQRLGQEAVQGLVGVAEPGLLAKIEKRIAEEQEVIAKADALAKKLGGNLRLSRLHGLARDAAMTFGEFDWADRIEERVLAAYPEDKDARKAAVEERIRRGLLSRARYLAGALKLDGDEEFEALRRDTRLRGAEGIERLLAAGPVSAEDAADVLTPLLLRNRAADAARVLAAVDIEGERPDLQHAQALATAALALGDRARHAAWFLKSLEAQVQGARGPEAAAGIVSRVRAAWGLLDDAAREKVRKRLEEPGAQAKKEARAALTLARAEIDRELGAEAELPRETLEELIEQGSPNLPALAAIALRAKEEDQGPLLALALGKVKILNRYQVTNVLDQAGRDLGAEVGDRLVEAYKSAGKRARAAGGILPEWWEARRLSERPDNLALAERMAGILCEEIPGDPLILMARGILLRRMGRTAEGDELIAPNLKRLLQKRKLEWHETELVESLAENEDFADLRAVAASVLEEQEKSGQKAPAARLLRARLLAAEGKLAEAGRALEAAWNENPDNDQIRTALEQNLAERGQTARSAELLAAWLKGRSADDRWYYNDLARRWREVERPAAALEALDRGGPEADLPLRMFLEVELGRPEAAARAFRRHLSQVRRQRFFGGWQWPGPLGAGGIDSEPEPDEEFDEEGNPLPPTKDKPATIVGPASAHVRSLYWKLAEEPWGREVLDRAVKSRGGAGFLENDPLFAGAAYGILKSKPRDEVVAALEAKVKSGEWSAVDLQLLLVLAGTDPAAFPASLQPGLDLIRDQLSAMPDSGPWMLGGIADLYVKTGRVAEGRTILLALAAQALEAGGPGFGGGAGAALPHLDRYVESFPEAERAGIRKGLLASFEPHPLRRPEAAFELAVAEQWEKAGEPEAAKDRVRRFEEALGLEASRPPPAPGPGIGLPRQRRLGSERMNLARWYGQRGDAEGFGRQVEALARLVEADPRGTSWSASAILPAAKKAVQPTVLAEALRPLLAKAKPGRAARESLDVAAWLARAGAATDALPWLEAAAPAILERAPQRLIEADVRRAAGDSAAADRIERELLDSRSLNLRRLRRVLDVLAAAEGEAAASAKALAVSEYSDHPVALRRGAEAALASGDKSRARALLDRLSVVSPNDPQIRALRARL